MALNKPVFLAVLLVIMIGFFVVFSMDVLQITKQRKTEIAVVLQPNHVRADEWQMISEGVKAAAEEYDVNMDITGPIVAMDTAGQIRAIEEVLENKPDAVILAASNEDQLRPSIQRIKESGSKLILINSRAQATDALSQIGTDHVEAGRKAGQILAGRQSGHEFKVITLSSESSIIEKDRLDGFREAVAVFPDVKYAGHYELSENEDAAYEQVRRLLLLEPDIQGIVGLNETAVLGAARAVKEMKEQASIQMIGFDSSIYEIKLLEEGILQAIIVQKPFNIGYLSIETTVQALNGIKVSPMINIDSVVITKENMYSPENQELLFPLVEK